MWLESCGSGKFSSEFPKFFGCESRVLDYAAHGERIHRVRPRNGEDSFAVGHDDMLALANHAETSFLECANGTRVRDARYLGHLHRDLDLPYVRTLRQL